MYKTGEIGNSGVTYERVEVTLREIYKSMLPLAFKQDLEEMNYWSDVMVGLEFLAHLFSVQSPKMRPRDRDYARDVHTRLSCEETYKALESLIPVTKGTMQRDAARRMVKESLRNIFLSYEVLGKDEEGYYWTGLESKTLLEIDNNPSLTPTAHKMEDVLKKIEEDI